jgi:hypothetical protein
MLQEVLRRTKMLTAKKPVKPMKMPEIREKARALGITPGKMKKADLIHAIQQAEGCTPCFGTSKGQCQYLDCCFIHDCHKIN